MPWATKLVASSRCAAWHCEDAGASTNGRMQLTKQARSTCAKAAFCFRSPLLCLIAKLCTGTWASCPSSVGVQLPGNRLYGSPGQTKQEEEIEFSPVAFDSGDSVIISVWVPTSSQPLVLKAALRAVTSSRFRKCSNNNRRITETQATPRASRVASCSCVWGLFFGGLRKGPPRWRRISRDSSQKALFFNTLFTMNAKGRLIFPGLFKL